MLARVSMDRIVSGAGPLVRALRAYVDVVR